jgi:hypothetical protein
LVNQVIHEALTVSVSQCPAATSALEEQALGWYVQAAAQSSAEANALVQNEIQLNIDLTMAFDLGVLGISDPALQAQIATQEQAVDTNPLYSTTAGYNLALSVGALTSAFLNQPGQASVLMSSALQQANTDNAQQDPSAGFDQGVWVGAVVLNGFNLPDPTLQGTITAAQQADPAGGLSTTPLLGFELGLFAGAQADLDDTQAAGLL